MHLARQRMHGVLHGQANSRVGPKAVENLLPMGLDGHVL
jgi:hypothetical protein